MLPIVFCLALEIGLIPGPGFDQSLLMPEYALYQAVELEVVVSNHVFLGGAARLYEWNDAGCGLVSATALMFAGVRLYAFEIGWRYHFPDQIISSFPWESMFFPTERHEFYLRMSNRDLGQK